MGVVDVEISPPYRQGGKDVVYIHRKEPAVGRGSPQRGVQTRGGKAPGSITLSQGISKIRISNGKRIAFSQQGSQRGPGILMPNGRVKRQGRMI